ncbi:hypothetical protein GCM10027046_13440 [Uliginosibacterium flavum]|uniref:Uncharacterized protein n=1 Tax=Uliginosibacterium flavum TaxID=1396831 RepID=A0ABV2TSA7_9RHOO
MTIALNANNQNGNDIVIDGVATSSTGAFTQGVKAIFAGLTTELPQRVGECDFGLHDSRFYGITNSKAA